MNASYQAMRAFWLDVKNLQHKKEVPQLGLQKICVAGVEMTAHDDHEQLKHILIVASSLGNASVYFENNSPSGIGGFTGGAANGPVREKALLLLQAAARMAGKLCPVAEMPAQTQPDQVTLFTVSADGQIRTQVLPQAQARLPEDEGHAFFAYSQQLLGAFRAQQADAAAAEKK